MGLRLRDRESRIRERAESERAGERAAPTREEKRERREREERERDTHTHEYVGTYVRSSGSSRVLPVSIRKGRSGVEEREEV